MTLPEAVRVFDSHQMDADYPDQVGYIKCCGQYVVERYGAISCDRCHTVIERHNGEWRIMRVKGKTYQSAGG
jgi:hypothetical protein